jgi:PAS domain S-box-containing protein
MPVVVEGVIEGVHCIAFNITDQKSTQKEGLLISKLRDIFNKEGNLEECLRLLLYELCEEFEDIQVAEAWITNFDDEQLRLVTQYSRTGQILAQDGRIAFRKGQGLIGKVWWDQKELFLPDLVSAPLFQHKNFALQNKLKSGLAIPVIFNGKVLSVLAFFVTESVEVDKEILDLRDAFLYQLASEIQRKKSEFELRQFFHITPDILYIAGIDGYFKKVNASFTRILGYSDNIISSKPIIDLVHTDDRQATQKEFDRLVQGDTPTIHFENRCLTHDGSYKWLAWTASSLIEKGLLFGAARDITEKKSLEKRIANEQQRFIKLFNEAPVCMCILKGKDHILTHANEEYYKLTGRSRDEVGRGIKEIFPEFEEQGFIRLLDKVFESGETFVTREAKFAIHTEGGGQINGFIDFMYQPYRDDDGQVEGIFYFGVDVTERKHAEEELVKLSLIAKNTINAVIITKENGIIEWVNNAFTKVTEYSYEESIGKKVSSLLYGDESDTETRRYINDKIANQEAFECEILQYSKSGRPFWVVIHGQPLFENGELTHYFNIETDITERKRSYDELVRKENEIRNFASHLNSVLEEERSRIAREIHDEFGQQLTGLKMSLSTLRKQATDAATEETINDMLRGIEATVQAMREFSNELQPVILDTLGLIPSIEWLVNEFRRKTMIHCELKVTNRTETINKSLSTAFFRVCQEALTNITKHAHAKTVKVVLNHAGDRLIMEIHDDGVGIQSEHVNNPFSIGLTGMRERAKLIDAKLEIRSNKEMKGTSVCLTCHLTPSYENTHS